MMNLLISHSPRWWLLTGAINVHYNRDEIVSVHSLHFAVIHKQFIAFVACDVRNKNLNHTSSTNIMLIERRLWNVRRNSENFVVILTRLGFLTLEYRLSIFYDRVFNKNMGRDLLKKLWEGWKIIKSQKIKIYLCR